MRQDYIIGDVVEYNNKVMVIKELLNNNELVELSSPKEETKRYYTPTWKINPVLLSTIILKGNGWDITEVDCKSNDPELHHETFTKGCMVLDVRYYHNWSDDNRKFFVFVDSEKILHFQYVHELQHMLWAMGKDSTMIV